MGFRSLRTGLHVRLLQGATLIMLSSAEQPVAAQTPGGAAPDMTLPATGEAPVAGSTTAARMSAETGADEGEIIVTGSRIARSGFTTPTPVTVLGQDRVQQRGITNVGDALNELPSFRPLTSPLTQQAAGGNIGARTLDLRGLGAQRTLVLLDSKRFIPSTTVGTVDVNLIPTPLIGRTEVVTGGASAAYGSDAVAGVVNFILDKKFTGLRGSVQYGTSQRGDGQNYNAQLAYGMHFGGDRGHLILSGEYDKTRKIGDCYTRSWCPNEQLVSNTPAGFAGLPASLRVGPDSAGNLARGGLIVVPGGPLRGITFNADGSARQYGYGTIFGTNLSPVFTQGGEAAGDNGYLSGILLLPPVERVTAFAHADYEFSDALRANLDLSFGQVKGLVRGSQARGTFTITRTNAFLPANIAAIMDANNIASFSLGRIFGDLGGATDRSRNRTYRGVASLEGKIGSSWSWDAYYQFGRNEFQQNYTNNPVIGRLTNAINAVNAPTGVQCAVNVDAIATNDAPGCVPFNPFGPGRYSAAAGAYAATSGFQSATTRQDVLAANIRGDLFRLPGGALTIAAGPEYRSDRIRGAADALSSANAFWSFNGKAISGKIEVIEGYVEAVAPILKDVAFARSLELNGAVRRTHYERSSPGLRGTDSDVTTWKLGAVWEPIQQLRFRANRSRDIRSPNITELFGPVTSGRVTIIDPVNGGSQIQINSLSGSNPSLRPETANTWTVGAALSPNWDFARSLRLSVDYFDIKLKGAIATLGAQVVVDRCNGGATEFCPFVTRDASNQLTLVQDVLQNVNRQINRGIDIEASYTSRLPGTLGSLDVRLLATHYIEFATVDSVRTIDRTGQTGFRPGTTTGVPDWIVDGFVNWNVGRATLGLHGHYIPKGIFDTQLVGPQGAGYAPTLATSIDNNRVGARFYLDLNGSFRLTPQVELFGVVNNLLDKDPPLAASAQGGTDQVYFDPIGRYFKVGARVKF